MNGIRAALKRREMTNKIYYACRHMRMLHFKISLTRVLITAKEKFRANITETLQVPPTRVNKIAPQV